ncbi:ANTAR domain-containing protein [Rothia sp. ARF10]|nr:ANTAR domain-containing protein [Rothia sp. ARF10]
MDVDDILTSLARGLVEGADRGVALPLRLGRSAARVLDCDGAAITMAYTQPERVTLCTTDDTALILEEAQDVTGQGPGPDAFTTGAYQHLQLVEADDRPRSWPLLRFDSVPDLAPLVVHALPLGPTGEAVGVLTLYQRGLGRSIDLEVAGIVSRAVTAALLADVPTQSFIDHGPWSERAEVHQATGMVVAQLHVPEADALALIRGHAYSNDQSVGASAHAVVTRRLRFAASSDQEIETS